MSTEKEHFERVVHQLRGNGTLSPGAAAGALEGYDNAVAEIATFEGLKAEDERNTLPLGTPPVVTSPAPAGPSTPNGIWPSATEDAIAKGAPIETGDLAKSTFTGTLTVDDAPKQDVLASERRDPTEDDVPTIDLGIEPEPELTRDGEVKPRTKSKHSK